VGSLTGVACSGAALAMCRIVGISVSLDVHGCRILLSVMSWIIILRTSGGFLSRQAYGLATSISAAARRGLWRHANCIWGGQTPCLTLPFCFAASGCYQLANVVTSGVNPHSPENNQCI
jgi:hypothetical protein